MSLFPLFLTKLPIDTARIEEAIADLERETSAELRVVVERKNKSGLPALQRAEQLFDELNMFETAERNGVLLYLSFKPHHIAVVGDVGIHQKVGQDFWQGVYEVMRGDCQQKQYTQGICNAIAQIASQLSHYFPRQEDDVNELDNEVIIK